jgi:uncharacterized protein (DUF58 family)
MAGRRIFYFIVLVGAFCFCVAYQKWLAWMLLFVLLALPVFSLVVSLPAMLTARLRLSVPEQVTVGQPVELTILSKCSLPTPPWRLKLRVERPLTGQRWAVREAGSLCTEHCGALIIQARKARICDYMGLIRIPVRLQPREQRILIRPRPVPVPELPSLEGCVRQAWKPKPGGGFAENHELRLYRPGDSIQQIHWKLSAKTGKLILREPMEPVRGRVLVRMNLKGTPEQLDKWLGQLLWLGRELLDKDIHFQIQCLTGNGVEHWDVSSAETLNCALDALLSRPRSLDGSLRDMAENALWQYFIGGDGHED